MILRLKRWSWTLWLIVSRPHTAVRVALNPRWRCRFDSHDLIPRLPNCWRCWRWWETWDEALAARDDHILGPKWVKP